MTSNDVKLRLPVFDIDGIAVAVLLCEDPDGHLGLLLTRDPRGTDPTRPRYYTGIESRRSDISPGYRARLAVLGRDLRDLHFNGKRIDARWRTIHITPSPPEWLSPGSTNALLTLNCAPVPPFRFPHWIVSRFVALQFRVWEDITTPELVRVTVMRPGGAERIWLDLGLCTESASASAGAGNAGNAGTADAPNGAPIPHHWSKVTISYEDNYLRHTSVSQTHSCAEHHIDGWAAGTKEFGDADRTVRLSFAPCRRSPATTRVVHVELEGRIYCEMLREANVAFPPPGGRRKGVQVAAAGSASQP